MKINHNHIPKNPGCYLFKDSENKVIYVGKAKNLVKRVKSYFAKVHEDTKTNVLVSHIVSVDYVVTDSEVEALILENNLIKKYKPRYNIDLKDSKRYAYIEVTGEQFPRILVARTRKAEGGRRKAAKSRFYGPFVSGMSRDYVLHALRKIFKIRTCVKLPKKVCMRFEIGLCSGPCEGKINGKDYLEDVKSAEMVLKGKTRAVVEILTKRMKSFSAGQDFERALVVREQVRAVKDLGEKQKMERDKKYDEDFVNWIVLDSRKKIIHGRARTSTDEIKKQDERDLKDFGERRVYLILFNARKGILENKQSFEFEWTPNFLEEFLVQFYSDYDCPKEVVLPESVDSGLKKFIERLGGKVVVPKVGEKLKLLELVRKNVEIGVFGDSDKLVELRDKLKSVVGGRWSMVGDDWMPRVIECFDISHLSGTNVVASMVLFRDGKADKSSYRKFKISVDTNDDFAAMAEVVRRRYSRLREIRDSKLDVSKEEEMPDLILVDGGKGQLSSSMEILDELGLKIPIVSLAKREEEVFVPGKSAPIVLDKKGKALKLLIEIRDEAHRFAISYQRLLRGKKILK